MTYLLGQIALLILGAYLLGAVGGCVSRRVFDNVFGKDEQGGVDASSRASGAAPVIEVSNGGTGTGQTSRFERALSEGPGSEQSKPAQSGSSPVDAGTSSTEDVKLDTPTFSPVADPVVPEGNQSSSSHVDSQPSASVEGSSSKPDTAPAPDEGEPFSAVSVAAAAAAAAMATRAALAPAPVEESAPEAPVAASLLSDDQQDLTRIRGIDSDLQKRLYEVEVSRYEHISSWNGDDVQHVESLIGSPGRVSKENWIEQAQILSSGSVTEFARKQDGGADREDRGDERDSSQGGQGSRLNVSSVVLDASNDSSAAVAAAAATATAATMAAATATGAFASYDESREPLSEGFASDPLTRVDGIDDKIAGWLNAHEITAFEQIANWSERDVTHFEDLIGESGRISGERWVEQAGLLARGDDGVPSEIVAPASTAAEEETTVTIVDVPADVGVNGDKVASDTSGNTDDVSNMSGFRSVRSAALRGDSGSAHGDDHDDLKRIRGVGILIEKKLYSLGVTSYLQVANWTKEDIDRISQKLEFKGRIERENWVEQARILTSGGATEFSSRMDRKVD